MVIIWTNIKHRFSGACLLLSYIVDNLIFVANAGMIIIGCHCHRNHLVSIVTKCNKTILTMIIGDSKAVFGQKIKDAAGNDCWGVIPLSSPHTADTEAEL